jgi:hypothetical protein
VPADRLGELPVGHLDVLDRAENVRELEAHELDLLALETLHQLGFAVVAGHARIMAQLFRSSGRQSR